MDSRLSMVPRGRRRVGSGRPFTVDEHRAKAGAFDVGRELATFDRLLRVIGDGQAFARANGSREIRGSEAETDLRDLEADHAEVHHDRLPNRAGETEHGDGAQ